MTAKISSTFQASTKCSSSGFYCCALQLIISEFNKNDPTPLEFAHVEVVGCLFQCPVLNFELPVQFWQDVNWWGRRMRGQGN